MIVEALGRAGLNHRDDADVRVVIEKPFGTSLAEAEELNRRVLSVFNEQPGLPHRPLPGQGDGPERPGVPLRQRALRAALEPQLHRPRPDHRGRGHRHRQPRELLRQRRRAARPRAEPHAPAAVPALHGAAGDVHGQRGPRREGEGPPRDHAADGGGGAGDVGPRAVHRAARSAARRSRATSRRRASRPTRTTETYAALRLEVDNWRWAGVPDVPAHGQAPGAQGHRDRRRPQAGPAPRLPAGRARRTCGPTSSS